MAGRKAGKPRGEDSTSQERPTHKYAPDQAHMYINIEYRISQYDTITATLRQSSPNFALTLASSAPSALYLLMVRYHHP